MVFTEQFHNILFHQDFASVVILVMSFISEVFTSFSYPNSRGNNNDLGNYKLVFTFYHSVIADKSSCILISKISSSIQQIPILIKLH